MHRRVALFWRAPPHRRTRHRPRGIDCQRSGRGRDTIGPVDDEDHLIPPQASYHASRAPPRACPNTAATSRRCVPPARRTPRQPWTGKEPWPNALATGNRLRLWPARAGRVIHKNVHGFAHRHCPPFPSARPARGASSVEDPAGRVNVQRPAAGPRRQRWRDAGKRV